MIKNIFSDIPQGLSEEFIETLSESKNVKVKRIVSHGQKSKPDTWYDQDKNEFVLLIQGQAKLEFKEKDKITHLKPGDYLIIPAHKKHRVDWTPLNEDTVWLTVHY